MKRFVAAVFVSVIASLGWSVTASAAPITCPGSQEPVKTSSGWECENRGGNTSNAEDTKNPNTKKWGDRP